MSICSACCESFDESNPEYPYKGYKGYCISCAKGTFEEECNRLGEPYKPECQLTGGDGNVFTIIGKVKNALNQAGRKDQAKEFMERAFASDSYYAVLSLAQEYVDVT